MWTPDKAMTWQKVANLLSNVNPLSMWGAVIHLTLENPTEAHIAELVRELHSQAQDNPLMMREILGGTIYDKIISG
jgi:hypothetical protein